MTWIAAAIIGSTVLGVGATLVTGGQQAGAIESSTEASIAEQQRQFDLSQQITAPLQEAELARLDDQARAREQLFNILSGETDLSGLQIPGQDFALEQAGQTIERSAAARGGLVSGNTLSELNRQALGITNQNFLTNFLNPLQNLARPTGAPGVQQAGAGALNLGVNIGNQLTGAGVNRANIIGSQGAGVNQALQGGLSNFLLQSQLGGFGGGGVTPNPLSSQVLGGGVFS